MLSAAHVCASRFHDRQAAPSAFDICFEEALNGYVPVALRGIKLFKSSVAGRCRGLETVRRVLKETLNPNCRTPMRRAPLVCPRAFFFTVLEAERH